ncbi:MAG: hypothetical protein KDA46_02230 [Parvularculaceae bacterium]|nr:hypothetical protein [Parvularculaceae bacterium]
MELIVNLVLLATSGAAAVYCYILSIRLKKLNDTRAGLGASIAAMSTALDQTKHTLTVAREASLESIERLTALLEEGQRLAPELTQLMDALDELASIAADDIERARVGAIEDVAATRQAGAGRRDAA